MEYTPANVVRHSEFDPREYSWKKYRTDTVLGCACRLLQEFAVWMEINKGKGHLPDHLGMARMLLSDALRDAGLDDEAVHTAIAYKSVMIAEEIANKMYQEFHSPSHKEFVTTEEARKHKKRKAR